VREINCEVLRLAQSGKKLNEMLKLNGDANVCGYGRVVHMVHMVPHGLHWFDAAEFISA
jgi:hypothetical protein